jgi:hypothetical protein
MTAWGRLEVPAGPAGLTTIGSGVATGLGAVRDALVAARAQVAVTQALARQTDATTVQLASTAAQAVVTAITGAINTLLDDGGVYALAVPVPKKGAAALVANALQSNNEGPAITRAPTNSLLRMIAPTLAANLRTNPLFANVLDPDTTLNGGNAYFLKTLLESVYDAGDANRPRFPANGVYAYALFLAGASDLTSLASALPFFDRMFGLQGASTTGQGIADAIPTNVRAILQPRGTSVSLAWEPAPVTRLLSVFDGGVRTATHFAVIRSTDFRAKTARQVSDLFTGTLTEGATGNYGSRVVAIRPYDGVLSRWVDEGPLEPGQRYFYHLAYRTRLDRNPLRPQTEGTAPARTDAGYHQLSACAEVEIPRANARANNPQTRGTPPDWLRTPSLARIFPPANASVDLALAYLSRMVSGATTVAAYDQQVLDFLDREIARMGREVDSFSRFASSLAAAFQTPDVGVYTTTGGGTGNVGTFIADVAAKLADTSDDNRPPFDTGDEFVTGIVLLAVGASPIEIAAAAAAFQALFAPTPTRSGAGMGVSSVLTELATVEAELLAQLGEAAPTPTDAFGTDMTPSSPGVCGVEDFTAPNLDEGMEPEE